MNECEYLIYQLNECVKDILYLQKEKDALEVEVNRYRNAARLYGVDPDTMLALARSKIKTCADNIRITEKMQEVLGMFDIVPQDLTEQDLISAIVQYDGDGSKPYCDLVYCGLSIIRKYLQKRNEYDGWRAGNLPENL